MANNPVTDRRTWVVAGAAALLAVGGVLALFRNPKPAPPAEARGPTPALGVAPLDPILQERAALNDPTPLFLPTRWNGRPRVPAPDPGAGFGGYPPEFQFAANRLGPLLPPPISVPANPPDALVDHPPGNPLEGIGRSDAVPPRLPPRGAFVEVIESGTGRRVLALSAPAASPPQRGALYHLEFAAEVDATGLAGPLSLDVVASDAPGEAGAYFEHYLARVLWIGNRLAPGSYRILVGP